MSLMCSFGRVNFLVVFESVLLSQWNDMPCEIFKSIILNMSFLFLIFYFSESTGFFLFGLSSLYVLYHFSSELLWFAYMRSVFRAA